MNERITCQFIWLGFTRCPTGLRSRNDCSPAQRAGIAHAKATGYLRGLQGRARAMLGKSARVGEVAKVTGPPGGRFIGSRMMIR